MEKLVAKYILTVDAKASSLTVVADIIQNTMQAPLPDPIYDDVWARPTKPLPIRLESGEYVMAFDVQNGSGDFTLAIKNLAGITIASQAFTAPPQVQRFWYFTIT